MISVARLSPEASENEAVQYGRYINTRLTVVEARSLEPNWIGLVQQCLLEADKQSPALKQISIRNWSESTDGMFLDRKMYALSLWVFVR